MENILDSLLRPNVPNVISERPTSKYEVKRLSGILGEKCVFELRALSFDRINELKDAPDMTIQVVLEGVISPDLRNKALMDRFSAHTPSETVKALLLPGEIDALQIAVEKLSGYRGSAIEEIRKNSTVGTMGA